MGTRFVATRESAAPIAYKQMIVDSDTEDIVDADSITGLQANWLRPSIVANGLDPDDPPAPLTRHRPNLSAGVRSWRTVWSAGHSAGLVRDVPRVAELVDRWADELGGELAHGWQSRLADRLRRDA